MMTNDKEIMDEYAKVEREKLNFERTRHNDKIDLWLRVGKFFARSLLVLFITALGATGIFFLSQIECEAEPEPEFTDKEIRQMRKEMSMDAWNECVNKVGLEDCLCAKDPDDCKL